MRPQALTANVWFPISSPTTSGAMLSVINGSMQNEQCTRVPQWQPARNKSLIIGDIIS